MSFNLAELEVHIREILTSPGTDLSTISARGVRQKLTELVSWLKPEVAKRRKQEIDEVITEIYQAICPDTADAEEAASGEEAEETRKRKQESDEENLGQGPDEDDAQPAKKVKHEEDGKGKARKARGSANGAAKRPGRPRKSAATVESGGESEDGGKKKRGRKKSTGEGGGAKGGFSKEFTLSEPLAKVVGAEKLSRPQVVKQLWHYIKENRLQNPENGKEIFLDDNLKALFDGDKINMFTMNKCLGQHLLKD